MIWVDSNENAMSKIPSMLKEIGLPVQIGSAPIGEPRFDYVINDMIAVERKEVSDYFQSVNSGHLSTQLWEMQTNFEVSWLVIIGDIFGYMQKNNISLQNYLGSNIGSSLKRSPDGKNGVTFVTNVLYDEDFVLFIKMLHSKVLEGNFARLPKFETHNPSPDNEAINFLCGLPNIGPVKAKAILKEYTSVANAIWVLMLKEDSKWNIKGIGDKTMADIKKVLNHNYGETE